MEASNMQVFVTGATGFIGSAIVPELIGAGHEVVGLARSDRAAAALADAGAHVHRGDLEDPASLRAAAHDSEGVIHTAFRHDFSRMDENGRIDLRAVEALGEALAGSDRPLVIASGTALVRGRVATEADSADPRSAGAHRVRSEQAALSLAARAVRSSVVRLSPSVHGEGDHGFVPFLIDIARREGVSAYIGDGENRWAAVHRLDAARLFRQALESAPGGSVLHGVADEGVPTRDIAEVIGRQLELPVVSIAPEDAAGHFGWLAAFFGADVPASSSLTRERLGWQPVGPGLINDLEQGHYFEIRATVTG
jgi:nucleoside-diphosphate-sugar epimerase